MEITLDQTAGLDFGSEVEGVPIKCKIGKNGHMTINVQYKNSYQKLDYPKNEKNVSSERYYPSTIELFSLSYCASRSLMPSRMNFDMVVFCNPAIIFSRW